MNTFKLKIQTELDGKDVIRIIQATTLHLASIEKKRTYKPYPPLTTEQLQLFKVFTIRGYSAHFIFTQLGQNITPTSARKKAQTYRKKLKLKEYAEVPRCMATV